VRERRGCIAGRIRRIAGPRLSMNFLCFALAFVLALRRAVWHEEIVFGRWTVVFFGDIIVPWIDAWTAWCE
jgi:hypothetical protein